jgi:hypothetical protein
MSNSVNADDESYQYNKRTRPFRRSRRVEAGTWLESLTLETQVSIKDKGLLCKTCHKWIQWKDLYAKYEMWGLMLVRMWTCGWCDTVLTWDDLTRPDGDEDQSQLPTS